MKRLLRLMVIGFGWLVATPVLAYSGDTGLTTTGKGIFDENLTFAQIVGNVINGFLIMTGLILMIIVVIGGIKYMTAGGDTKHVQEGKDYIKNGIIGLIIISLAYSFSSYIMTRIGGAATGNVPATAPGNPVGTPSGTGPIQQNPSGTPDLTAPVPAGATSAPG